MRAQQKEKKISVCKTCSISPSCTHLLISAQFMWKSFHFWPGKSKCVHGHSVNIINRRGRYSGRMHTLLSFPTLIPSIRFSISFLCPSCQFSLLHPLFSFYI